jgi:hypothetical protein
VFLAAGGFLFGQVFASVFSPGGLLAGAGGLVAGLVPPRPGWQRIVMGDAALLVLGLAVARVSS